MDLIALSIAAYITGFLGSLHCVGMCGAIACSKMLFVGVQHQSNLPNAVKEEGGQLIFLTALLFNFSRISMYAILGGILALFGQQLILSNNLESIAMGVRITGVVLIALIGLRFLINLRWVDKIEYIGLKFWTRVKPNKFVTNTSNTSVPRIVTLGFLWGLLPCALVYTMLLTATTAGSAMSGALIMFAFGLGTLPAMQGMSIFGDSVRLFAQKPWLRKAFGLALILIAVYVLMFNFQMVASHQHH